MMPLIIFHFTPLSQLSQLSQLVASSTRNGSYFLVHLHFQALKAFQLLNDSLVPLIFLVRMVVD